MGWGIGRCAAPPELLARLHGDALAHVAPWYAVARSAPPDGDVTGLLTGRSPSGVDSRAMANVTSVDDFLAAPEARSLGEISEPARREVARRMLAALRELDVPIAELGDGEAHGWLLHAIPDRFEPGDALAPHVAPVISAWLDFAARASGAKLTAFRRACDEILPELPDVLEHGHAHHHDAPEEPYVREMPKVGRNDPCPCGSGKKAKKCHGAG